MVEVAERVPLKIIAVTSCDPSPCRFGLESWDCRRFGVFTRWRPWRTCIRLRHLGLGTIYGKHRWLSLGLPVGRNIEWLGHAIANQEHADCSHVHPICGATAHPRARPLMAAGHRSNRRNCLRYTGTTWAWLACENGTWRYSTGSTVPYHRRFD